LIGFIDSNTSTWQSVWLPLIGAFVYTGLFRNLISALVEFTVRWGGDLNLKISKGSKVPMDKFLTYRNMYLQTNKELEKVIEDERKTIEEFDKQRQQVVKLEGDNVGLHGEVKRLLANNANLELERSTLSEVARNLQAQVEQQDEKIKATQGLVDRYKDVNFMDGRWKFRYDNKFRGRYFYDVLNKKLFFVLTFIEGSPQRNFIHRIYAQAEAFQAKDNTEYATYYRTKYEPVLIHDLDVSDGNELVGTENIEALIAYERLS
jgi:hypothetical protein